MVPQNSSVGELRTEANSMTQQRAPHGQMGGRELPELSMTLSQMSMSF